MKERIVQNHLIISPHVVYSATFITNVACSKVTRCDIYNNKTVGVANNGELFEIHQVRVVLQYYFIAIYSMMLTKIHLHQNYMECLNILHKRPANARACLHTQHKKTKQ